MKASEYAKQFRVAGSTIEALTDVVRAMMQEVAKIGKSRHIQTDGGLFSILNEMQQKWEAFVRIVDDITIKPDGFEKMVQYHTPDIHYAWMNSRQRSVTAS